MFGYFTIWVTSANANDTAMACSLEEWLLTARLLCRMAVAMDSFSASERLDFSQCVTKMDLSRVGPILLPCGAQGCSLCMQSKHFLCRVLPFQSLEWHNLR